MSVIDPEDPDRIDQEIRINELKEEANELAGGEMTSWESDSCPPGLAEQFWRHVVDYEKAPDTTNYRHLVAAGMELPAPETMTDEQLTSKLWELIDRLARLRTFLTCTNHMNDRELYTRLWGDTLHEVTKDLPLDEDSACHLDFASSGSEEDTHAYLKHYADEKDRQHWQESFPDDEIPDHEEPPYDRDRHLPRATYGRPSEEGGSEKLDLPDEWE
jgi:hypothetical protein